MKLVNYSPISPNYKYSYSKQVAFVLFGAWRAIKQLKNIYGREFTGMEHCEWTTTD